LIPSEDFNLRAKIEVDFQNGGKESRALLRMRHAYFVLAIKQFELLGGQTWDLLAPLYPGANSDGMMWNAGNLGDRHPQVRLTFSQPVGAGSLSLATAATMTGAVDNQDLDDNGELDGFAAATPGLQARIGMEYPLRPHAPLKIGVWGGWGREETQMPFAGKTAFESWVTGFDLSLPLIDGLLLEGEGWLGENLSDLRGGIGQSINPSTGEEISAMGGWAQVQARATKSWRFFAGLAADSPKRAEVPVGGRTFNIAGFAVTRFRPWKAFEIGLEYLYWVTEYRDLKRGVDNRVDLHLTCFL